MSSYSRCVGAWKANQLQATLAMVLAGVLMVGCGGGGGVSEEPAPAAQQTQAAVALSAQASTDLASTTSEITLRAIAKVSGTTILNYTWALPGGGTASGQEIVVKLPKPGRNDVRVQASAADGSTHEATTTVFIVDAATVGTPSLTALGINGEIGNVDGQPGLNVLDVLTIAQHASAVETRSRDVAILGDINLDGRVDEKDVDLALSAALAGT